MLNKMKLNVVVTNGTHVMKELERAGELLKELQEILSGYSGLGQRIEIKLVPAQDEQVQEEISCCLESE